MRILSLGAGVQSSTLALLAEKDIIKKPDYAIFADTGWEPRAVYEWLDYLKSQLSYPVITIGDKNIKNDLLDSIETKGNYRSVPFFTENGGMGRRQCTSEYKLTPIRKKVRLLCGYAPRKRIPVGTVTMLIGISTDEIRRMKPSRDRWITNEWPLIDLGMSRDDCLRWLQEHGYPRAPRSACIGCPYHSNKEWEYMKNNDPESFIDACYIDNKLRASMTYKEFMHPSRIPLHSVNFNKNKNIIHMDNECEGICGV